MSKKDALVVLANLELQRIGIDTKNLAGFSICLNDDGVISAADDSGYYPCKNHRLLLSDLKEFTDNLITDPLYDGNEAHVWTEIWGLFSC